MNSVKLTVAISIIALLSVACADANNVGNPAQTINPPAASPTAPPDEFASIRPIFASQCVECHGAQGDGGQVTIEGKKLNVPSLKEGHALKHTDADFVDQIRDGGDGMPAFKDKLKPEEITGLVQFVRKEFQKQ